MSIFQGGELLCAWVCDGNLPPPLRGGGAVGHAGPDGPVLLRHLLASVIFHRSSFRDDWKAFLRVLVPLQQDLITNNVIKYITSSDNVNTFYFHIEPT